MVVGIDQQFTYDKLRFAHAAITRGHAQFIATNRDATFPMETGEIPGGGSLVAALATAAGREPLTIGKPETHAYEEILQAAGVPARTERHGRRPPGHGYRAGQPGRRPHRPGADRRHSPEAARNAPSAWRPETYYRRPARTGLDRRAV